MTVYAIQNDDTKHIKIGHTNGDPLVRLRGLQTGNASVLRLLGVVWGASLQDERDLHDRFAAMRIRGEWFRADLSLIEWAYGLSRAIDFWGWLRAQEGREDLIGDFAEDVMRTYRLHCRVPRLACPPIESGDLETWAKHLRQLGACHEAMESLWTAHREWVRGV